MRIPFNKPHITGKETDYILDAISSGHLSGNGNYTKKCQSFFEERYGIKRALLTTSCTDALEMCAILIDIEPGDEIIMPSYAFVSTALAFVSRGAKIVFVDSYESNPNIDPEQIEKQITNHTKAIVVLHYAGIACHMDQIIEIANKYDLFVIEDAAQAIEAKYDGKPLGSIGHLATFSFHETKNIQSGEGGILAINDSRFIKRAEIIWEKGTNRSEFFRGEVNKYGWIDLGSSFLPSELIASFLFAQLENIEEIQQRRITIWEQYLSGLKSMESEGFFQLTKIPTYASNNAHMFYLVLKSEKQRAKLISLLKEKGILAVFHYQSLHKSKYYQDKHDGRVLKYSDYYTDRLLRLPLYFSLNSDEIAEIIYTIKDFFMKHRQ